MRVRRLLVVDDSAEFLAGACRWLGQLEGLRVVGTARDGAEALAIAERLAPDIVLVDGAMPGLDGFELTRRQRRGGASMLIIITSFHEAPTVRNAALAAGADEFVSKADLVERFLLVLEQLVRDRAGG